MEKPIPSASEVRQLLLPLPHAKLQRLAKESGVPFGTLWKIRSGDTQNPGIDTVRALLGGLPSCIDAAPPAEVSHAT